MEEQEREKERNWNKNSFLIRTLALASKNPGGRRLGVGVFCNCSAN